MRKLLVFVFVFVSFYSGLRAQSMCAGSSATIVPTSTLTNPSYTLNPGNFTPANGVFVVSPPVTTIYTLIAVSGSTTNSTPVTVTVFPQPNTSLTITPATCTNSYNAVNLGLTFTPASPAPSYTITWAPLPPSVLAPTQSTASNLTAGPYTVSIATAGGCTAAVLFTMNPQPSPATFTVIPFGNTQSITCTHTVVDMNATNVALNYTWTGASFAPVNSASITLTSTNLGTFTLTGENPGSGCTTTYTFLLALNNTVPTSTLSQNLVNITCSQTMAPTLSITANPQVNIMHYIYSPNNTGTFSTASYTAIYNIGPVGIYTYVVVNTINGCEAVKFFTVTSSDFFPTFSVASPLTPQASGNFTLGCGTKSVAPLNIVNPQSGIPPGSGPISYTLIGPGTSTVIPAPPAVLLGSLNNNVTLPGTYTVIVRDGTNNCETRSAVSILQNTFEPVVTEVKIPQQILDCNTPKIVLDGFSETPNVSYSWAFGGPAPGSVVSNTIAVTANTAVPSNTLLNTYTLTITDLSSTCKSFTVVPIYQNVYTPSISITSSSNPAITCKSPTLILVNNSSPGTPTATGFPGGQPVGGDLWEGPSPQQPLQASSSYTAGTVGLYTLTGRDANNGCTAKGTFSVSEGRQYPVITPQVTPAIIDCGAPFVLLAPVITGSLLTYTWTPPTATSVVNQTSLASLQVKYPGTYTLDVANSGNGCRVTSTLKAITGSLTAAFTSDVEQGYAPLTVVFTNGSSSSNGTGSITTSWNFGNATTLTTTASNPITPQTIYTQPGTFTVTMFVTKGACLDTAFKVINVDIPSSLVIPNVFTPNNDGINDLFFLKSNNLTEITMVVFDRWGQIVYELTSTNGNVEWDGKNGQGKDAAEGTYFYTLKSTGKDGSAYDKKGTISLYR